MIECTYCVSVTRRFAAICCVATSICGMAALGQVSPAARSNPTATSTSAAPVAQPAQAGAVSAWASSHERQMMTDWPDLAKFREKDAALPPPMLGENRVVFMGDSITEIWPFHGPYPIAKDDQFFPGKFYVNRGISGQTTPQMLVRFRQDVIDLNPKAVVILAGTNDLAGNTGPESIADIENYLKSMSDLAHANGIQVVLCSILPVYDYPWKPGLQPAPKIVAINQWMKSYAADKGYVYVDYYSAMVDSRGGLPSNLSKDGVHPNQAGFKIMAPIAEAGIEKALGKPATATARTSTAACNPIPGVATLWGNPSTHFILVGEMHGTQEQPAIFGDLVCAAATESHREIIVGLERPTSEQLEINAVVDSQDPSLATSELLKQPMWSTLDGRSSQAMVTLLDRLQNDRAEGKIKEVVAFDAGGPQDTSAIRDKKMGTFLRGVASQNPSALILVLTGNLHPLKASKRGYDYPFMGMYLPSGQVKSLAVIDKGGTAWIWVKDGCNVHPMESTNGLERGVFLDPKRAPFWVPAGGYDGVLSTGQRITASLPAIPNPPKPPTCVAN